MADQNGTTAPLAPGDIVLVPARIRTIGRGLVFVDQDDSTEEDAWFFDEGDVYPLAAVRGEPHTTPTELPRTARGFAIYADFVDTYGKRVDVLQSSLATEDRVWIHAEGGSAHLDASQARLVRDALNRWLSYAEGGVDRG